MRGIFAIAVGCAAVLSALSPVIGQAAPPDDELSPALQTVRECVALSKRLDVLMVIDESTSLVDSPGTDREARRVDGMLGAIDALVTLSEKSAGADQTLDVNLMLAAFATDFTPVTTGSPSSDATGFVPVSLATQAELSGVAEQFRQRVTGRDTDFGAAFNGSLESFFQRSVSQASVDTPAPCKLLILFTDGALSLRSDGAETATKDELCRPNGIADQTRSSDIVTIVVALTNGSLSNPANDPGLLERVATGVDRNGALCGTTGSPSTGQYIPVSDSGQLAEQLRKVFDEIAPPLPPAVVPCRTDAPCVGRFDVPALAEGFTLKGTAAGTVETIELTAPNGATVQFSGTTPISTAVSGAEVGFQPGAGGGFRIQAVTTGSAPGQWSWSIQYTVTTDPSAAVPQVTISLTSDLVGVVVQPAQIRLGEPTELTVEIQRPSGSIGVVDGSVVVVTWKETGQVIEVTGPDADGRWVGTLTVPSSSTAAYVTLIVAASVPSVGDQEFFVRNGVARLPVVVPGALVVIPSPLVFPPLKGEGSTKSSFTITAPPEAGGCVWLTDANVSTSRGDTAELNSNFTSETTCLRVEAGETLKLPLSFTVTRAALGGARGTISVTTTSDNQAVAQRTVPVEVSFEMGPAGNWRWRVAAIILAVFSFILLTLLVLHLIALWSARFEQRNRISWLSFDVVVDSAGVRLRANDETIVLGATPSLKPISKQDDRLRQFTHEGFDFVAHPKGLARPSWRALFDGAYGRVQSSDGSEAVVSGATQAKLWQDPEFRSNEMMLGLRGTWLFRGRPEKTGHQPGASPSWRGQLLLLEETSPAGLQRMTALLRAAENILPRQIRQMAVPARRDRWRRRAFSPPTRRNGEDSSTGAFFE